RLRHSGTQRMRIYFAPNSHAIDFICCHSLLRCRGSSAQWPCHNESTRPCPGLDGRRSPPDRAAATAVPPSRHRRSPSPPAHTPPIPLTAGASQGWAYSPPIPRGGLTAANRLRVTHHQVPCRCRPPPNRFPAHFVSARPCLSRAPA